MSEDKKVVDLGLLEQDDEFEEFPAEGLIFSKDLFRSTLFYYEYLIFLEWDSKDEDQTDINVWEDNWDDDVVEDDFSVQLR